MFDSLLDIIPRKAWFVLIGLMVLVLAMIVPAYMARGYSKAAGTKSSVPIEAKKKKSLINNGTMYYPQ